MFLPKSHSLLLKLGSIVKPDFPVSLPNSYSFLLVRSAISRPVIDLERSRMGQSDIQESVTTRQFLKNRRGVLPNSHSFSLVRSVTVKPVIQSGIQEPATGLPLTPAPSPSSDSGDSDAPEVGDKNKRFFLKIAGIAGAGLVSSLLWPKKADALILGSSPTTGVVGVKDASNVRINPATEETLDTVLKKTDLTFDTGSVEVKVTSLPTGSSSFSDSAGVPKSGLVNAARNVQVDVLSSALPASASTEDTLETISFGGVQFALRLATDSVDTNIDYVGEASIGSATSDTAWRIKKIDSTTGVVIQWADGNGSFDNIWNNRETLSYS